MSELFRMRGSEGYRACDDERLLVVLLSSPSAELQRFDCSRTPSIWTAFFYAMKKPSAGDPAGGFEI